MQAALHQQLAFCLMNQLNGLRGGGLAVGCIDEFEAADVNRMLARRTSNLASWSDQDRLNDSSLRCLRRPAQRRFVARVNDKSCRSRNRFRPLDQPVVLAASRVSRRAQSRD